MDDCGRPPCPFHFEFYDSYEPPMSMLHSVQHGPLQQCLTAKLLEGFFWARGLKNHFPDARNMLGESLKKPHQSKQSVSFEAQNTVMYTTKKEKS